MHSGNRRHGPRNDRIFIDIARLRRTMGARDSDILNALFSLSGPLNYLIPFAPFPAVARVRRACRVPIVALATVLVTTMAGGCAVLGLPPAGDGADPGEAPVDAVAGSPRDDNAGEEAVAGAGVFELDADIVFDYLLADIAERRGAGGASLEAMVRLAERTRDRALVVRAFRGAVRAGDGEAALAMVDLLDEIGENPIQGGFARVQAHLLGGDAGAAVEVILGLLEAYPDERERVFNNAGEIFAQQGDPAAYLAAMESVADAYPEDYRGYFALSYLANRARDDAVLERAIGRVLELRPDWEQAAVVRYVQLLQRGDQDKAFTFAEAFLARNRDALSLAERHARVLASQGELDAALGHFQRILRRQADNGDVLFAVALIRMQREEWNEARRALVKHLELDPDSDETRLHLGSVAAAQERYDEAVEWYSEVRDDALVFTAQLRIAGVLRERGDHEAALDHLASLVPVSREEEVDLLLTREQVLRQMGRLEEAIELIDGALGEVPDDPDLLYSRGLLAAELSRLDLHEKDMRRVIELDPDNAHAYNALGYTLADQTERYEEALDLITRALELAPDDPFILDSMGWVQYRLGDLDQAEQYLRRALDLRSDAEIAAHLGEVLWVAGVRDEARRLWDEALRIDPENRTLLRTLERFTGQ